MMKCSIRDLELFDNVEDLDKMFRICNALFFHGEVRDVQLFYSTQMRNAAGICILARPIKIGISQALLYEATEYELVNTLVHEMCHALVFERDEDDGQRDGHGPLWFSIANRINCEFGLRITRYHYQIAPEQLRQMEQNSARRRQQIFLGRGHLIQHAIDCVDLGPRCSIQVCMVDLEASVVDLS